MKNFGLEYEDLVAVNPTLSWSIRAPSVIGASIGTHPVRAARSNPWPAGTELIGYEGGDPLGSGTLWCDPVSGYHTAAAVLTALHYRCRTGQGQQVDVSMQECNALFHADALMQVSLGGGVRRRAGNHHVQYAPHNIYASQDGKWLAMAVRNEDEWRHLCKLTANGAWLEDPRFASMADRKRNEAGSTSCSAPGARTGRRASRRAARATPSRGNGPRSL